MNGVQYGGVAVVGVVFEDKGEVAYDVSRLENADVPPEKGDSSLKKALNLKP